MAQKKRDKQHIFLQKLYCNYIKRILDIFLSIVAILLLSPIILGTGIIVRIKLGSPVIFCQKRPGKNENIFKMYKFRSMTNAKDENGNLLSDEQRLTNFGKKIRETSLDELPELFNILKGDMSFVGPRPQLIQDMVFMTKKQRKRHTVVPGLTGLAQINGRNNITWEEKIKWDLQYIRHISFRTDFSILLKTVKKVLLKENISSEGMETSENLGEYLLRMNKITTNIYIKKLKSINQKYKGI